MDSDGTVAYEGGGYSFSASGTINEFGKFDPVANTWTPLAPVPDLNNAAGLRRICAQRQQALRLRWRRSHHRHGGQYHPHLRHSDQHMEYRSADA